MGSAGSGAKPDEQPQHKVKLDAFWMQTHEVTWDAYLMFMFVDQANETREARSVGGRRSAGRRRPMSR